MSEIDNSNQLKMSKARFRKVYKNILRNLSTEYQINSMKKINSTLFHNIKSYNDSEPNLIMSFMKIPNQNEINLNCINAFLAQKKRLVLPKVNIETNHLDIYLVTDLNTLVSVPPYNILEPHPDKHKRVDPTSLHTIFIPGLAFDKDNNRLGRGKGYYDRFLKSVPITTRKIGVGFMEQYTTTILPIDDNDVKVDDVIFPF
jgi:5-formyltetrahydrofolate cyclo-ligase